MGIINTVKGNLVEALLSDSIDVLVHGCNCFCTFGAGIALEIKNKIPGAYSVDCATKYNDASKLGSYTTYQFKNKTVVNMYTQFGYGSKGPNVDYEAIKKGFETLNKNYKNFNLKIGIPKIGAGLAGGDWDAISSIINDATPDLNITLYEFVLVNKESV